MSRFYLTTPIYYPNAEPHLGTVYSTLAADTLARYHRLAGDDTYFLTGTDEHGQKMAKTAAEQGIEPQALVDRVVNEFQQVWKELDITHDDFIRTTEPRHKQAVQKIVQQLLDNGDIYFGAYEGWYDEGQEEFVSETTAKEQDFKSAISGRPLVRFKEASYFFRLAKYAPRVLEHIKAHPQFVQPASRRNEVIGRLEGLFASAEGMEDLSISRATLKWGIPMPNDPQHVVYVWIDALTNYITALGYGSDDTSLFKKYWPADLHLIGKDILWFHSVYWPAMLFSLGLEPPKRVFGHGWWTAEGRKMSKSLGNAVGMEKVRELGKTYGFDALRYYLLRAAPFGSDLDWTDADFHKAFNELANVAGNCLNRTLNMAGKYRGQLPPLGELEDIDRNLIEQTKRLGPQLAEAYAKLELQQCALLPIELARTTNGYIDATAPFKLAKDPAKVSRLDTVLHVSSQAIYAALVGLLPILPEKAAAGLKQLGASIEGKTIQQLLNAGLSVGHPIAPGQPLFPKVETAK